MDSLRKTILQLQKDVFPAQLMVVTKNQSSEKIREVMAAGAKIIGENRLQEIQEKYDLKLFRELRQKEVQLHFIGHLQTNKAGKVVRYADCIQSVDSGKLAEKIEGEAKRLEKIVEVFLQLNLSGEEQKYGFTKEELEKAVSAVRKFPHLQLRGLMCMGKQGDAEETRRIFRECRELANRHNLAEISMGMSDDYRIAVEEGSTLVRLGSLVFQPNVTP